MRDADCAKNMENALKKYLVVKIAKNINQKHNIPPPALKSRGFLCKNAKSMHLHTICNAYAKQLNYIILN
jgi:hypothetical protein